MISRSHHPGRHRDDEDQRAPIEKAHVDDAWAWAYAGKPPSNPEDEAAHNERRVDLGYPRQSQFFAQKRPAAPSRERKGHEPDRYRARHDKGE
jgi:hypothetical protein